MTTKKQFIALYNGRQFKRIVTKGTTIEDIDKLREELEYIAKQNDTTLVETDSKFTLEGFNNVFIKPVQKRETIGTLVFTSNAIKFNNGESTTTGGLPSADVIHDTYFTADYGNVAYRYEVLA